MLIGTRDSGEFGKAQPMRFEGEITVPAPRAAVWEKIRDARFLAGCIAGVRDLAEVDGARYTAVIETRIAYIKVTFDVAVEVVRADPPRAIEVKVEGKPMKLVGRLAATSTTTLDEDGGTTRIRYATELSLTGKLGSLGRPALTAKAKDMERQFAENLQQAFR